MALMSAIDRILLLAIAVAFAITGAEPSLAQSPGDALKVSAAAEKAAGSIVAIGRIRRDPSSPPFIERERFPPQDYRSGPGPADPEFFPHEFGAGVVIDRGGLILTSLHLLGEISHSEYFVWVQRRAFPAKVKAADPWLDVAVLEIAADDLLPIELGDAREIKPGDRVIVLGDPLGIARDGDPSVAAGKIVKIACEAPANTSTVMRNGLDQMAVRRDTLHHYGTLLQFETESPQHCSGGAVINLEGQLVGLQTTYVASPGEEAAGNLAIPIDADFRKALETLKRGALPEYGLLGVALPLTAGPAGPAGKLGASVDDVMPGTPAAKAGLRSGDVITHLGDVAVRDDLQLIRLVSAMPAGSTTTVQVLRDPRSKKSFSVPITLSKKYHESAREAYAEVREPVWRGMRVDFATASPLFREMVRHVDPEGCVAIVDVERDSPAWKAGLRRGLFVSHVGDQRVSSPQQFREQVEQASGEAALRITAAGEGDSVRRVAAP